MATAVKPRARMRRWQVGDAATGYSIPKGSKSAWRRIDELAGIGLPHQAVEPWRRIVSIARSNGCRSVVCEHRYVDRDYRSEFSQFWSRRFNEKPSLATRVHFFRAELGPEHLHRLPPNHGYLGYSVLRPTELGPVGRTVVAPPPEVTTATLTMLRDRPTFFGQELSVEGVPFYQQDGEFLSCAHAAAWICHYVAHHRHVVARHTTGDIAQLPPAQLSRFRALPASGLNSEQMQAMLTSIGIPAIAYGLDDLPTVPGRPRTGPELEDLVDYRDRVVGIVCKYLTSGFPVIVLTDDHAFTLVGWELRGADLRLIASDDQVGPYETIEVPVNAPLEDRRMPWIGFMMPVPPKVFLTGEAAETRALASLSAEGDLADASGEKDEPSTGAGSVAGSIGPDGAIGMRTQLMECRTFKARIGEQGRPGELVRLYRLAHLSHWVWVIEFHDKRRSDAGKPCVVAEVIMDSTSHDDLPFVHLLATRELAMDVAEMRKVGAQDSSVAIRRHMRPWRSLSSLDG